MKFLLAVLISISLSSSVFSQVKITVKGADSNLLYTCTYSDLDIRTIGKSKNGEEVILNLKTINKETLVLLGCNEDVYFLWAKPGDTFEVDAQNGLIKGSDYEINQYLEKWKKDFLWNKNIVSQNHFMSNVVRRKHAKYDIDAFFKVNYVDKIKSETKKQLKDLEKKKFDNKVFVEYFNKFIKSNYKQTLVSVASLITFNEKKTPEKILQEIVAFDMQDGFMNRNIKDNLLGGYIRAHESLKLVDPTLKDYVYQKGKLFKSLELKEYYVLSQLKRLISRSECLYVKELFDSSCPLIKSKEGKKEFEALYAKQAPSAYNNKKVHPLKAYTVEGREISLDEFKGKYIYIDVWATWCAPCKQMTPHFIKLAEKYKEKDIIFLSLSTDNKSAEGKWRKYVKEHFGANCVPVWTKNGFNNQFVKHYKINAIPRFILIDPQGNVFSSKFWRPNDPRVETIFEQLLP